MAKKLREDITDQAIRVLIEASPEYPCTERNAVFAAALELIKQMNPARRTIDYFVRKCLEHKWLSGFSAPWHLAIEAAERGASPSVRQLAVSAYAKQGYAKAAERAAVVLLGRRLNKEEVLAVVEEVLNRATAPDEDEYMNLVERNLPDLPDSESEAIRSRIRARYVDLTTGCW